MSEQTRRSTRDVWTAENARGLALAAAASWPEAVDAFSRAADAVDGVQPPEIASHDALALVLGNLAQACFRAGRIDDGIRHAQRTCALRTALVGDDAISSARARADLAVMLGSTGRLDEATALMDRAIACMEQSAGDDDVRLIGPLENAARLALASAQPANAEPHLLRLHALLAAHGYPTTRAEGLLARVASARIARGKVIGGNGTANGNAANGKATNGNAGTATSASAGLSHTATSHAIPRVAVRKTTPVSAPYVSPVASSRVTPQATPSIAPPTSSVAPSTVPLESPSRNAMADDEQLIDALRVTDSLLRTPPRSTPPDAGMRVPADELLAANDVRLDLVDEFLERGGGASLVSDAELSDDLLDDDDDDVADAEVEIVGSELLSANDEASLLAVRDDESSTGLGFTVEHGPGQHRTPSWVDVTGFGPAEIGRDDIFAEPSAAGQMPPLAAAPGSVAAATDATAPSGRPPEVRFYVTPAEGFVTGTISETKPKQSVPEGIPVVMPTPRSGLFGSKGERSIRNVTSQGRTVKASDAKGSRRVRDVEDFPRITRKRSKEPTKGLALWQAWIIGAGIVAVACAVVVWYFRYRPV